MLDIADKLAIHELLALYGHIVDDRQFSRADEVFTEDVRYDMVSFGEGVIIGRQAVVDLWSRPTMRHPLAHHATNILISVDADGTVRVKSKGLGIGYGGRVGSVNYDDIVRKEGGRWLMAERVCRLRTPDSIPAIT
jgi:SnoaL-like domain